MKDSDPDRSTKNEDGTVNRVTQGPLEAFKRSIKLFFTKDMGLLSIAFFYIGSLFNHNIFHLYSNK